MVNDYYDTTGKKILDFFIGFIGVWILNSIISGVFAMVLSLMSGMGGNETGVMALLSVSFLITIAIDVLAVVLSFKMGRRFIGIGIISIVVVPLLIFGACIGFFALLSLGM